MDCVMAPQPVFPGGSAGGSSKVVGDLEEVDLFSKIVEVAIRHMATHNYRRTCRT